MKTGSWDEQDGRESIPFDEFYSPKKSLLYKLDESTSHYLLTESKCEIPGYYFSTSMSNKEQLNDKTT